MKDFFVRFMFSVFLFINKISSNFMLKTAWNRIQFVFKMSLKVKIIFESCSHLCHLPGQHQVEVSTESDSHSSPTLKEEKVQQT